MRDQRRSEDREASAAAASAVEQEEENKQRMPVWRSLEPGENLSKLSDRSRNHKSHFMPAVNKFPRPPTSELG